MATYFAATFTVGYAAYVLLLTSFTCGNSAGDAAEKCDIRTWYLSKIGEGLFPQQMTTEQQTIKSTIESLIQKSSTNSDEANVDCAMLKTYESMFKPDPKTTEKDVKEEVGEEGESEQTSEDENEEIDETEMFEDETEMEESEPSEEIAEGDIKGTSMEVINETSTAAKPAFLTLVRKCRVQKSNKTSNSCVFVNAITFRCILSETGFSEAEEASEEQPTIALSDTENEPNGAGHTAELNTEKNKLEASEGETKKEEKGSGDDLPADKKKVNRDDQNKYGDERKQESQHSVSKPDDTHTKSKGTTTLNNNGGHTRETIPTDNTHSSAGSRLDLNLFQQMFEKTASENMLKIQTLETQIMRLENELLMEKLNKQNHTSSFSRLENQILKLENELLKMNLSYEELKEENEKILKKQKSFLELDYVKHPGDYPALPDNSTKQFELISQHQDKISELTDHLRNQSKLIDKVRGQSENLEDQNRMLFQIVMNQTMLISQMMKKVEALSDSNLKQHMHQQMITDKLGIALASNHAMDDLHAIVSDKLHLVAEKQNTAEDNTWAKPHKSATLTLSRCHHPKRSRAVCGFNSMILSQCLWNQGSSIGVEIPTVSSNTNAIEKDAKQLPEEAKPKAERPSDKTLVSEKSIGSTLKDDANANDAEPKVHKDARKETSKQPSTSENKDTSEEKQIADKEDETVKVKPTEKEEKHITQSEKTKDSEQKTKDSQKLKKIPTESKQKSDGVKPKDDEKETPERPTQGEPKAPKQDEATKPKEAATKKPKDETKKPKAVAKKPKTEAKKSKAKRIPPLYNATRQAEPKDCSDYYRRGKQRDGLFKIRLHGTSELMSVFCDMKNGGWTVIQRRQDGTVNFFRTWDEYKQGFGGVFGEHWLGNDIIHRLTNQAEYELRVDLMDWNKEKKFAEYEYVRVDDEASGYMLHIDGYSGNAGDGFSKHNGEKFSTKDRDNDRVVKEFDGSCANRFKGAWWYYKCYASNLNGKFYKYGKIPEKLYDGVTWKPWTGPNISLKKVEIKVRPISART